MYRMWLRFSAIVLTALAIGLGLLLWLAPKSDRNRPKPPGPPAPVVKVAQPGAPRHLSDFARWPGTPFLMAEVYSGDDASPSTSSSFSLSSGYYRRVTHNYVFLDITDLSVRPLLPNNDACISQLHTFPGGSKTVFGASVAPLGDGVKWLLYEVVTQDTNGDRVVDDNDLSTLAVSDVGGRGYTELIRNVRKRCGETVRDPDTLVVVFESGGKRMVSEVDLTRRTVVSTKALPDLGVDLK